jgi:glycosyltransferase involved in cell wall biosynthesis
MTHIHQMLVSAECGGAAMVALQLAAFLRQHGPAIHVWIPAPGVAAARATQLGFAPHFYDADSVFSAATLTAMTGNWHIGRALYSHRPGLVHVHSPLHYGAMQLGLGLSGLKRVVHIHITTPADALQWAFKNPPELIITCARYLVEEVRRALPAAYQERQWIVCVPNGVDVQRFSPGDKQAAKQQVGAPLDVPLVLMLANLAPHKGQETAIHVTAALQQAGVRIVLWLAGTERGGDAHYTAYLHTLCKTLAVTDRVHFLGQRHDTPDLLRAADFFLLPSTHEGLPLSILEAQATRLPVLAAPTAGIPEMITHGKTGFLLSAQDIAGYAMHLQRLLDEPMLYHTIAKQAYAQVIREYSWSQSCTRIWELYQQVQA